MSPRVRFSQPDEASTEVDYSVGVFVIGRWWLVRGYLLLESPRVCCSNIRGQTVSNTRALYGGNLCSCVVSLAFDNSITSYSKKEGMPIQSY